MRIGFFSDSYFPEVDGVTYTLKTWKQRLEERGHEVYIIYPDSDEYEPGEREVPVGSVGNPFYSGYNIPVPVRPELPELDIVHCHSPAPLGWLGRYYSYRNSVPSVYTHHTPLEEYFDQALRLESVSNFLGKMYVPMEERFLSSFDVVTCNTGGEGERDAPDEKLVVGIDMEFFQPSEPSLNEFERPIAGYAGRISREKNLGEVVEMAEEFDGTLIVVGEGPEKSRVKSEAPENVVFKDFLDREDLPGFYSMLDVFVTASTGDTLGLSPLEANACGTPVVAADVHPFNRTINQGNGLRYEKGNIEDFREKVENALQKDWNTGEAVSEHSVDGKIDKLEEIYNDVGGEKT
jgi:glycosyltransferase involved in cell wall biosynthesis